LQKQAQRKLTKKRRFAYAAGATFKKVDKTIAKGLR
jgi:hypothetical protein